MLIQQTVMVTLGPLPGHGENEKSLKNYLKAIEQGNLEKKPENWNGYIQI